MKKSGSPAPDELRSRAEKRLGETSARATPAEAMGQQDLERLVRELQVHQVELEMQNEELARARDETAALHERYLDLYDFAPVGYLTLDAGGMIREANLAGASLLGVPRGELAGRRLTLFLAPESRPAFADLLARVISGQHGFTCDASLERKGGETVHLHLGGEAFEADPWCRVVMVDVTQRRRAEEELARHRDTLEELVRERTAELQAALAEAGRLNALLTEERRLGRTG